MSVLRKCELWTENQWRLHYTTPNQMRSFVFLRLSLGKVSSLLKWNPKFYIFLWTEIFCSSSGSSNFHRLWTVCQVCVVQILIVLILQWFVTMQYDHYLTIEHALLSFYSIRRVMIWTIALNLKAPKFLCLNRRTQ